ncbi:MULTISPECIES: hypothetical protein [Actinoplanes]|uniref:hypothetical protein n=1 Tax=Actinoplanes TaxID=1865 RepID=UPI0005F2D7F8|nr:MULTISPECIES: hypothetical protein [Actinoplanes]GLY05077.1 hypothetical protein Acsp01_54560 [Actinoplanes sp. NBRC 101535]
MRAFGGRGNDQLYGGNGHDLITGGNGADRIEVAPAFSTVARTPTCARAGCPTPMIACETEQAW